MTSFSLSNGLTLPGIGFGVFRIPDGQTVINATHHALQCGYRNIDTATLYGNESGIGKALKTQALARSRVTITTKVWNTDQGYDGTKAAFKSSLDKLSIKYIDLYLVHWPVQKSLAATWRAMEEIYDSGKVKAIGVCNFSIAHLKTLAKTAKVLPMVNQIEFHPRLQSPELVEFCQNQGILVQAWAPIMRGEVNRIAPLQSIAKKYNSTPTAVTLAWIRNNGIMALPKSQNQTRMKENFESLNLDLDPADINVLNSLNQNVRLGPPLANFWR